LDGCFCDATDNRSGSRAVGLLSIERKRRELRESTVGTQWRPRKVIYENDMSIPDVSAPSGKCLMDIPIDGFVRAANSK